MKIDHPTLLLDEKKCRANIINMKNRARRYGLKLRPHFKTHQSALIGSWFRQEGIHNCAVSSIRMAEYFAGHGWNDILIAFPVNIRALEEINYLASKVRLQLLVSDATALDALLESVRYPVGLRIEVDTGQGRTGYKPDDHASIDGMLEKVRQHKAARFMGFYSHPGHTYSASGKNEIRSVYRAVAEKMGLLNNRYREAYSGMEISCGDTPGCSVSEDFGAITEITPGNFVFYDLMQVQAEACSTSDVAVAMACPVVVKNEANGDVVIHGGAVHFSKDYLTDKSGTTYFGLVVQSLDVGWGDPVPGTRLSRISQEHGIITTTNSAWLKSVSVGDIIYLLPVHSCLAADVMRSYRLLDGMWISGPSGFMP